MYLLNDSNQTGDMGRRGLEAGRYEHRCRYKLPLVNDNINMVGVFALVENPDIGWEITAESGA